jgi:hypothetical protein
MCTLKRLFKWGDGGGRCIRDSKKYLRVKETRLKANLLCASNLSYKVMGGFGF